MIKIKNLSKKFGNFSVLHDLSFEVGDKRVVGFLGPNGAGKTTTIRIMAGLSRADSGSVEILGQAVTFGQVSTNRLFGYLPEQPVFYNWMTGAEYLSFCADIFGLKSEVKAKRIEELLKMANLTEAKDRKIGGYSNGMKQRLGIAQALINDPAILILDEPVSALDPIGRHEVLEVIKKLKKDKTIFLSTHVLADVDKICDDVVILNKGKLVATSSLADLKAKYTEAILEVSFASEVPQELIKKLEAKSWSKRHEKRGKLLRIWLKSAEILETNQLLDLFLSEGQVVLKYEKIVPEAEDLFFSLIKEQR